MITTYRLSFISPLNIDGQSVGSYLKTASFIHSDTLSAAILSAWADLEPEGKEKRFQNPPFLLSSAFPYFGSLYFLPRPLHSQAIQLKETDLEEAKKIKKIKWFEKSLWSTVVTHPSEWHYKIDYELVSGTLAVSKQDYDDSMRFPFWKIEDPVRVSMNRINGHVAPGQLFNLCRIDYHQHAGLYFLVKFAHSEVQRAFEAALAWLGDTGMGADRHCGNGLFEYQRANVQFPHVENNAIALSVVCPNEEECQNNDWLTGSAYELLRRGGWIAGTGKRKQAVHMFGEGSCFSRSIKGRIVEMGQHPTLGYQIYRDGRGFFVGGADG